MNKKNHRLTGCSTKSFRKELNMPRPRFSKHISRNEYNMLPFWFSKDFKIPQKEFEKVVIRARHAYVNCVELFRKDALGEEDIIQEALLAACETINHYKRKKTIDLIKLMHKSVGWRLKELIRNAKEANKRFTNIISNEQFEHIICPQTNVKHIFLETAYILCNKKEYKLLYQIFVEGKTYKEIADKKGVSRQQVGKEYSEVLHKIRRKLKIKNKGG